MRSSQNKKKNVNMVHRPSNVFEIVDVYIYKNDISQEVPSFFVFFEAFWYNKISKCGLPGRRKSINHQTSRILCLK